MGTTTTRTTTTTTTTQTTTTTTTRYPRSLDGQLILTDLFAGQKKMQLADSQTYYCCCGINHAGNSVTCELRDESSAGLNSYAWGCGKFFEDKRSWITIGTLPEFAEIPNAGACVVPRAKTP